MPVELRNAQRRVKIDTRGLKKDAQKILKALELQEQTLSLLLTGDKEMAKLHGQWMGDPEPTDVLSFAQGERGILGDVVISLETAQRRKPDALEQEVRRYLVHGVLHLLGHDHVEPEERLRMQKEERRLMKRLHEE